MIECEPSGRVGSLMASPLSGGAIHSLAVHREIPGSVQKARWLLAPTKRVSTVYSLWQGARTLGSRGAYSESRDRMLPTSASAGTSRTTPLNDE